MSLIGPERRLLRAAIRPESGTNRKCQARAQNVASGPKGNIDIISMAKAAGAPTRRPRPFFPRVEGVLQNFGDVRCSTRGRPRAYVSMM
jgi:hypothetical protein